MDNTHATHDNTPQDRIDAAIAAYRPTLLSARQAAQALERMRELAELVAPTTVHAAQNLLISQSRFLSEVAPPDSCDVDALLTEARVSIWSHEWKATGRPQNTLKNHLARLNKVLRAKAGHQLPAPVPPRPRRAREIYDEALLLDLAGQLSEADPAAAALVVAGAGAGVVVPDVIAAVVRPLEIGWAVAAPGGESHIARRWWPLAQRVAHVTVSEDAWARARSAAASTPLGDLERFGLQLSWVLARLSEPGCATEVLRAIGTSYRPIDAAVPHLPVRTDHERARLLRD